MLTQALVDRWTPQALAGLRAHGIVTVPWLLFNREMLEIFLHLKGWPEYDQHVKAYSNGEARPLYTCYDMAAVLSAPHMLRTALCFTDLAAQYLERFPYLYSMNAFWTHPGAGAATASLHEYHRDEDDERFLVLFMYGTEVLKLEDGAHQYRKGTLPGGQGGGEVEMPIGGAGRMFLADTRGLHRGERPREHKRLLLWTRWGVSCPPASYITDKLKPVDAGLVRDYPAHDPRLVKSLQLVVQPACDLVSASPNGPALTAG